MNPADSSLESMIVRDVCRSLLQTLKEMNSEELGKPDDVIDREELRQAMMHAMVSSKAEV
mgnify:CR=1 FL=1